MSNFLNMIIARRTFTPSSRNSCARRFVANLMILISLFIAVQTTLGQDRISLADGRVGQYYEAQLVMEGGAGKPTWAKGGGAWNFGLDLSSDGKLCGKPDKAGTFTVEVKVSDESGQTVSQAFTVNITSPLRILPQRKQADPGEVLKPLESNSDSGTITVSNEFKPGDEIDMATGDINPNYATKMIERLIGGPGGLRLNDYCIVHIARWKNYDGQGKKYDSDDYWHLYQKVRTTEGDDWAERKNQGGKRIYGSSRVAILIIHIGALSTWDIKYSVKVTGKIPTPLQNLLELVSVASSKGADDKTSTKVDLWGGRILDNITEIPSDLTVQGNTLFLNEGNDHTQQAKGFERIYDNEGRYHWDVSVGLPFKQVEDLEYDFNPTNAFAGVVTVKQKSRQNAYGFLNVFLNPKGVDLKEEGFLSTPHLVFGLPIAGKPLDRPMAGVGMGIYKYPIKFNFFVGAVFNKVQSLKTLQPGDATDAGTFNSDLQYRRVTKLIFGVNLPVRQFVEAIKK